MDISFAAPVSGMSAAQLRLDNTAHNVANVNTQGFAPQRVEQVEKAQPASGVQTGADTFESTIGAGTAAYNAGTAEPDLARDMTDLVTEKNSYAANAATVKVQNEVLGTVVDLVG